MELDEFKSIIRQKPVKVWSRRVISRDEINILKQSRSVITRIKKSLQLEIAFTFLFIFLISFITQSLQNFYVELFAWITTAICFCFTFYIIRLYRKIIYYHSAISSVKKTLEQIISILEQFIRVYFILTLAIVPVILIAAIVLGYVSLGAMLRTSIVPYSGQQLIVLAGLSLGWCVAMYFFTKWYLRKLYGRHLAALKDQLKELENE